MSVDEKKEPRQGTPFQVSMAIELFNAHHYIVLEPAFQVPSAMELTPEKFHDFLSLASSPSLSDSGSPKVAFQSMQPTSKESDTSLVGSPPAPSFAQVNVKHMV